MLPSLERLLRTLGGPKSSTTTPWVLAIIICLIFLETKENYQKTPARRLSLLAFPSRPL